MTDTSGPRPQIGDLEAIPPKSLAYGNLFVSPLAVHYDAPQHPLIVYGHDALDTASFISQASTLCALAVQEVKNVEKAVRNHSTVGIFAMSRPDFPGEAAEAIKTYRQLNQGLGLQLYGAWSRDPVDAATHAAECGAQGVIMPDTDAQEMFDYMYALLQAIGEEKPLPETPDDIVQHMKVAFQQSPFWSEQNQSVPSVW